MNQIPANSYSTIFHCTEGSFICVLRAFEGFISIAMFVLFFRGYRVMTRQQNNPLTTEDKNLYMLAMIQTFMLALYYLVFEEFFMLATIRNFLIWIAINVTQLFCHIFWLNDQTMQKRVGYVLTAAKIGNFVMWFFISLGQGSSLVNTDFNLGYNCRIPAWMIMSAFLTVITLCQAYIGINIHDKLSWEQKQLDPSDTRTFNSIRQQKINVILLMSSAAIGATIMFVWDYLAYTLSTSKESCEHLFSGDNFFRNVLCFLLKIISMQLNPSAIYYTVYYSRKDGFNPIMDKRQLDDNLLDDDGASDLNRTITSSRNSRNSSRKDLFSNRENNPSQYF